MKEKCIGCKYEFADGSTKDISNCVGCLRINDLAKKDKYNKKKVNNKEDK